MIVAMLQHFFLPMKPKMGCDLSRDVDPNANPNPNAPDARDFPDCEPGCISIMICQTANPDARKISRVRILDIQYRENGQGAWALESNLSRDVPNRSQSD